MNQSQSLEEVMQRIRAQIGRTEPANKTAAEPADGGRRTQEVAPTDAGPPFHLKLHELYQLKAEIQVAVDGARQVGQLNPRNPGPLNSAIQLVKKAMRRSLTWYTRPLHQHQGGVVRALDQLYAIVDNHSDLFRRVEEKFHRQSKDIERVKSEFEKQLEGVETKLYSLEKDWNAKLRDLQLEHEQRIALQQGLLKSALEEQVNPLSQRLNDSQNEANALHEELRKIRDRLAETSARARLHERSVRRALYELQSGAHSTQESRVTTPPMFRSEIKSDKEFDYFAFEDLYRGDEADIRARQSEYLEYFRGQQDVVDIGCGRGEFLELLRENQISARGIELGLDQFLICKEKGLDVVQSDLFTFLESLPDESLGGLFSAQVIEHMTASDQLRYVSLAFQKTKPGAPVIFETINAQCVYAVVRNFFLDPTHVRPVHPETLKFAMESMGFKKVELKFSGPVSDKQIPQLAGNENGPHLEAFNRAINELNNLIYGYQDYAAIGWK
jgi:O-antigen chain-terminating methyltransferase